MGAGAADVLLEMAMASSASGLATIVANPLEVAKTRLQVQRGLAEGASKTCSSASASASASGASGVVRYRGSIHAVITIIRTEGVAGAYRGFGGFAGYRVAMNGVRLGLYWPVKRRLLCSGADGGPLLGSTVACDILASGGTGILGAIAGNPFNVVKLRCMTASGENSQRAGAVAVTRALINNEGFGAFWLGMSAAVPRVVVGSIAQLTTYDAAKRFISGEDATDDWRVQMAASVTSSSVSVTCFCPFDVISSRLMGGKSAAEGGFTGFTDCLVRTVRAEGVWALQRGWLALFVRTGPTSTVTLVLWEYLRGLARQ